MRRGQDPGWELAPVAEYLTRRAGLSFRGWRRADLQARLGQAMEAAGSTGAADYRKLLAVDRQAFDRLVAAVTVGETYFFREPAQLELLRRELLPDLRCRRASGHVLQLWSAGCSTGEEAYSLAILLDEQGLAARYRVLATDISAAALRVAAAGVYRPWSLRGLSEERRRAWFRPTPAGFRILERYASPVTFRALNLLDPVPPADDGVEGVDVIFCRNVLIYLTPEAVGEVGRRLAAALAPDGWLVTSSSDPSLEHVEGLERAPTSAAPVYRRRARVPEAPAPPSASVLGPTAAGGPRGEEQERVDEPLQAARRALEQADYQRAALLARGLLEDGAGAEAHSLLVRALANPGRLSDALEASESAVALFPLDAELRYLHSLVLLEAERPAEAARAASAAIYLQADLAVAHLALARAEQRRGDTDAARRSARNARALLRSMPEDEPVALGDGELAGRLAAMAERQERQLAAATQTPPTAEQVLS